ncbi:MAG: ATP-dependent helicase [Oscillospiraceae bacterium]|jgi:superfamily I DNA/RNA helicase
MRSDWSNMTQQLRKLCGLQERTMSFSTFQKRFGIHLNPQQEAAVRKVDGPTLLLAVPGSGKTTVIVTRIGYLLLCCGVDPKQVLTMTYTVAATQDMQARFARIFGDALARQLEFRTINGVCSRIIRYYEYAKGRKAFILLSSDTEITKILRELYLAELHDYPSDNEIREIRTKITYCKNMMLKDEDIQTIEMENIPFFRIYDAYRCYMTEHGWMDYDDQMIYAQRILRKYPDILQYFQQRYRYLNVDEAQDTSKIQHLIIRMLAGVNSNLFMVGDEDQSIYGFRAAYPQALLEFEQNYPDGSVLLMEQNYRSSAVIVERANAFIRQNQNRHEKTMTTENASGIPIRHTVLADYNRQYDYLVRKAATCKTKTAVLYRNNDSAIPLIDLLEARGISYGCRQVEGLFFTHYLVRDVVEIIQFGYHPADAALFQTLYYKFCCGIRKESAQLACHRQEQTPEREILEVLLEDGQLEQWSIARIRKLRRNLAELREDSSYEAVYRILHFMGYGDYLQSRNADQSRVHVLLALANQNPRISDFLCRLEELQTIVSNGGTHPDSKFILSTIHASKGLEYDNVILIDVLDGIFPNVVAKKKGEPLSSEEEEALEEERRLFYVGVTRAKHQLELISAKRAYGEELREQPSFIYELLPYAPKKRREQVPIPRSAKKRSVQPPKSKTESRAVLQEKDYLPGTPIRHRRFGEGILEEKDGNTVSIRFASGEVKKLDLITCLKNQLIERR